MSELVRKTMKNWSQFNAQHSIGTSPIAGELFEGLAAFLSREVHQIKVSKVDVIIHYLSASSGGGSKANVATYCAVSDLDKIRDTWSARHNASVNKATIVFMQGHQPPECLTRLGAIFNMSPHFFLRHLEYWWSSRPQKSFAFPHSPSTSYRILRLTLFTPGEREEKRGWSSSPYIQTLRAKGESSMKNYLHDVTYEYVLNSDTSIVRTFNVHSTRYFSIEQEVTVTVQARDSGWLGMWKLLFARPCWYCSSSGLDRCWATSREWPEGQWRPERSWTTSRNPVFIPTTQTLPEETMNRVSGLRKSGSHRSEGQFVQSALSLLQNYGLTLDSVLSLADSFYALTEPFQTSASSICQLLDLTDTIIDASTGYNQFQSRYRNLENLSYHQDILKHLRRRLHESISDLESYQSPQWPRSYGSSDIGQSKSKAENATELLLADFRFLLSRTEYSYLSRQCLGGMSVCMNSATIEKSQHAIEQAKQIGLLT